MITDLRWLALEVKDLDVARDFYVEHLDLEVVQEDDREVALDVGGEPGTNLVLRRPTGLPRGGLHTHYALSLPADEYDDWYDRLSAEFDLVEHTFGSVRSLYFYDPDGNCVEVAGTGVDGPGIDGVFEVVLEVDDLSRAVELYEALGFEEMDRQGDRVRLRGPFDLELWTPRIGLADARGGVHVDLGLGVEDPSGAARAVLDHLDAHRAPEKLGGGAVRIRDPDGHAITFVGSEA